MARGVKVGEDGRPTQKLYGEAVCAECMQTFTPRAPNQVRGSEECKRAHQRGYAAGRRSAGLVSKSSPEVRLNAYLRRTYGLTLVEYEAMLAAQGGACKTCGEVPEEGRRLAVDHDHSCCPGQRSCGACVRSLLCIRCNSVLGFVEDNPELIRALLGYVEVHCVGT